MYIEAISSYNNRGKYNSGIEFTSKLNKIQIKPIELNKDNDILDSMAVKGAIDAVSLAVSRGQGKTNIEPAMQKVIDIVEEGVDASGKKFKKILDPITKNTKEYLAYDNKGRIKFHYWYDSKISESEISKRIIKEELYASNGRVAIQRTYYPNGIPKKTVMYHTNERTLALGSKVATGTIYYPNGKKKVHMVGFPGANYVIVKHYDIDGNLIKERKIMTQKGRNQV